MATKIVFSSIFYKKDFWKKKGKDSAEIFPSSEYFMNIFLQLKFDPALERKTFPLYANFTHS